MSFLFFRNKCVFALIVFLISTGNYFKQLLYIHSNKFNILMIFFTFYMDSWRVIIFYSAFNYDTVFYLIILSINLYIIFL